MITADEVRRLIVAHDAARPRSRQTAIGPSDLSSPCDRRLGYKLLGVPRVVPSDVNLPAWVGTGIHRQMESALQGDPDWLTETPIAIPVTDEVTLAGSCDAYHRPTSTILDWKSVGPSALAKYARETPANYRAQVGLYGLGMVLAGHVVTHVGIGYIPRNGHLSDIHVDVWPWDQGLVEASLRRYEALITAASIGEAVLPLLPTASDCRFCGWWNPNAWVDGLGCGGHETPGVVPVEQNTTQPEKVTTQP